MIDRVRNGLLLAEAFASGFIGSLMAQHVTWHLGRTLDRVETRPPCQDGAAGTVHGALHQRIWELWI